jgi:hypothetical protein
VVYEVFQHGDKLRFISYLADISVAALCLFMYQATFSFARDFLNLALSSTSSSHVTGPEVSRKLRFTDLMTTAQHGGKFVSLTHRPPLLPKKYSRYSFLLEAELTPGP